MLLSLCNFALDHILAALHCVVDLRQERSKSSFRSPRLDHKVFFVAESLPEIGVGVNLLYALKPATNEVWKQNESSHAALQDVFTDCHIGRISGLRCKLFACTDIDLQHESSL